MGGNKNEQKKQAKGPVPKPETSGNELSQIEKDTRKLEVEVAQLASLAEEMKRFRPGDQLSDGLLEACPELAEGAAKNAKLEFRKKFLERSVAERQAKNDASGVKAPPQPVEKKKEKKVRYVKVLENKASIFGPLEALFTEVLYELFPEFDIGDLPVLVETVKESFGDYQCNHSMQIAARLRAAGKPTKPLDVANQIADAVKAKKTPLIEKVVVAPPGYVNIFLAASEPSRRVLSQVAKGSVDLPVVEPRRVVVDFSSPNIAKEMHVGHLRSTIIGDSICRLLERVGYDVLRLNHIGDWGTQFGMLIAHLQDNFPDYATQPPPIADLQAFYKESKKRFDDDAEFKKRAYQCVVALQSGDKEIVKAWQLICDVSRASFLKLYQRLDVTVTERGESFYQSRMQAVIDELKQRELVREEEGRLVMFPTGCSVPLTVVKSDGGFTYDTSDLAALKHRLDEEKADWVLYVIDSGQSLHMETIYAAGRDLGWYDATKQRIEHVGFGLVLGEDRKKFKTRSGDTVRLSDLLDEGVRRSGEKLLEKGRDKEMTPEELKASQEAVAYGCIKYADLSQGRTQDYVFSFDRMLDDRGNTAAYLLYAYARIRSINRTCGVSSDEIRAWAVQHAQDTVFSHKDEIRLAKQLTRLSDVILQVLNSLQLHTLCEYLYVLSTTFADFYQTCYVVEKRDGQTTTHFDRLALCEATAQTMALCFQVLGIRTVEKM